jgi:two-component system response regulator YesN
MKSIDLHWRDEEMLKLLLVDDESFIRKNLRTAIDWKHYSIEIVAEAQDGFMALEKIVTHRPDIVLLDVHMPGMNGIEVLERLSTYDQKPYIIFLSGIKEFEYVRKALQYGAEGYLLKPVDRKELASMIEHIHHKVLREKYQNEYVQMLKKQVDESMPVLREQFLNRLILKPLDNKEISRKFPFFKMNIDVKRSTLLLIDIDELNGSNESEEQRLLILYSVSDLMTKMMNETNQIFFKTQEDLFVVLHCPGTQEYDGVTDLCERLVRTLSDVLDVHASIGVSRSTDELSRLHFCYKEAQEVLKTRFFNSGQRILYYGDILFENNQLPEIEYNDEQLVLAVKQGYRIETVEEINRMFSFVRTHPTIGYEYVITMALRLTSSMIGVLNELGYTVQEVFHQRGNPYMEVLKQKKLDDLQQSLEVIANEIVSFISDKKSSKNMKSVKNAIIYIEKYYQDGELTLKTISSQVDMSYSYFSHLFKQIMGETFSDYLNKVRVKQAKGLLEASDMRINEVAYAVGYNDPHYFSQSFKSVVGVSPSAYKNKLAK